MKNPLIGLIIASTLFSTVPALAQTASTTSPSLTPAQTQELRDREQEMIAQNTGALDPQSAAYQANEWIKVGQGVGAGLASAAHELNIVANDFAKTPVGMITVSLIIFKVIGRDIIHLFVGSVWFLFATSLWLYFYQKLWQPASKIIEYHENGKRSKVQTTAYEITDGVMAGYRFIGLFVLAVIWIAGLVTIFT